MLPIVGSLLDRVFVVLGAFAFAQAPHFFQAYIQRLGGHMTELKMQMAVLQLSADKSGKTLDQYIHKFLNHSDTDIVAQGEFMDSIVSRFSDISDTYYLMTHSPPLSLPFNFLQSLHLEIAKMTLQDFSMGLDLTFETTIYAIVGMGIGYLTFSFFKFVFLFIVKIPYRIVSSVSSKVLFLPQRTQRSLKKKS